MSDSVGKIKLDLEVGSDLNKQISEAASSFGKQLESVFKDGFKGIFEPINKSLESSMKALNETIKVSLDEMKANAKETFEYLKTLAKDIKMPSPNYVEPKTAVPKTDTTTGNKSTRGPPKSKTVDTEVLKAEIDNITRTLDNVNAQIEQQKAKLAQLREAYANTFNVKTKNKLEEKILKTEQAINRLISKSDKLGFKLADLDNVLASVGTETKESAAGFENLSEKTKMFTRNAALASNESSKLNNNLKKTNSSIKNTGNHAHSGSGGIAMMARSMFTWGIVFPMIIKGLGAMATGMMNNLKTSDQFVSSLNQIKTNLMVAFTPIYQAILPAINALMSALSKITAYIASFISALFGKTYQQSFKATQQLIDAKAAMGAYGDAAKKAGKDSKGALAGFDEINLLNFNDSNSNSDSGIPELVQPDLDMSAIDSNMNSFIDGVKAKMQEVFDIFKDGFKIGFGDTNFEGIKQALSGIKQSAKEIFTDPEVVNSAKNYARSIVFNLGKVTGAIASIGVTIAENLLGGIDKYLSQNKDYIKNALVGIFDAKTEIMNIIGDLATAIADIFSVFRSDTAKQITADIIGIFANTALGVIEIVSKLGRDILNCIAQPIIENKEKIKQALENTLKPIETILGSISDFVTNSFIKINAMYDEHIKPMFDALASGLSSILSTILDAYNSYIAPVLQSLADKFKELMDEHMGPLMDKFLSLIGTIADGIGQIWQNTLVPFINWIISTIIPILAPILETIGKLVLTCIEGIVDIIGGVIDVLKGLIDFIVGVFTGNWELAWTGIKEIFSSILDAILKVGETVMSGIEDAFSSTWNAIKDFTSEVWDNIKTSLSDTWEGIKAKCSEMFNGIKTNISNVWNDLKANSSIIWEEIKTTISSKWDELKTKCSTTWENIKTEFNNIVTFVKTTFSTGWNTAWEGVKTIFSNVFNSLIGIAKAPINAVIKMVNKLIEGLNSLSIDIPDWDIFGDLAGESFGVTIPKIPMLAKGGVIDSPTLAMVGEAGKEAVVPLENNTGWIDTLANKIVGILGANSNSINTEQQGGDIIFMLDGSIIGRVAIRELRKMQKQGVIKIIPT